MLVQLIVSVIFVLYCVEDCMAVSLQLHDNKEPPRKPSQFQKQQIGRAGDGLRLLCPAQADSSVYYEWFKDGSLIHPGWERHRVRHDVLDIRDLELDDTGLYTCRATNGFGKVEVTYIVFVSPTANSSASTPADFDEEFFQELYGKGEAPTFTGPDQISPRRLIRPAGTTLSLHCKAKGKPRPDVIWFKDGKMMSDDSRLLQHEEGGVRNGRWRLHLANISPLDSGVYTCRVFNKAGMINRTYHVDVSEPLTREEYSSLLRPPHVAASPSHEDNTEDNQPTDKVLAGQANPANGVNQSRSKLPPLIQSHVAIAVTAFVSCAVLFTALIIFLTYCRQARGSSARTRNSSTSVPLVIDSSQSLQKPDLEPSSHAHQNDYRYEHRYAVLEKPHAVAPPTGWGSTGAPPNASSPTDAQPIGWSSTGRTPSYGRSMSHDYPKLVLGKDSDSSYAYNEIADVSECCKKNFKSSASEYSRTISSESSASKGDRCPQCACMQWSGHQYGANQTHAILQPLCQANVSEDSDDHKININYMNSSEDPQQLSDSETDYAEERHRDRRATQGTDTTCDEYEVWYDVPATTHRSQTARVIRSLHATT